MSKVVIILSKKAITPVIAVVLLLMMTVSAAAGAYYWVSNMQSGLQETAESTVMSSGLGGGYEIAILSGGIDCDATNDEITVFIRNQGSKTIPNGTWYIFVKDSSNNAVGTWINITTGDISSSSITPIKFNSTSDMGTETYTVQVSSPKGTTATTSCKGRT